MENREKQILSEIKGLMNSVRIQLEQLDAKMAELQQVYDPQELEAEPIEIGIDVYPFDTDDDLPFVAESSTEPAEESAEEPLFMVLEDFPEDVEEEQQPESRTAAVIDIMATKHAWRNDIPGSPVKDIRAAIALVDRALFINSLFSENAMAFLETLNHINQVSSLDEAVEYLAAEHPEWDFDSDVVYRFMMAVRRKIS